MPFEVSNRNSALLHLAEEKRYSYFSSTEAHCRAHPMFYWTLKFLSKISLVILLTVWHAFLWCQFGEFGIGSTNNPPIDVFLYSHHYYAWYCIDIVRRNSLLVTHGRKRLKAFKHWKTVKHEKLWRKPFYSYFTCTFWCTKVCLCCL